MTNLELDSLTGLWNRTRGARVLRELLLCASVSEEQPVTLTLIDIDGFAILNRRYGYEFGDEFLNELVNSFEAELGPDETLCRFGGDEFMVISPAMSRGGAKLRAERIRRGVKELAPATADKPAVVTVTLGLAFWPKDGVSPEALTLAAERAVLQGKSLGGDCVALN